MLTGTPAGPRLDAVFKARSDQRMIHAKACVLIEAQLVRNHEAMGLSASTSESFHQSPRRFDPPGKLGRLCTDLQRLIGPATSYAWLFSRSPECMAGTRMATLGFSQLHQAHSHTCLICPAVEGSSSAWIPKIMW